MALGIPPSRFLTLRRFRACCAPQGLEPCLRFHLRALALTTRTDHRLGKPLPNQLPNLPQTHPQAKKHLNKKPFQEKSSIRYQPQFPRVIPVLRVGYPRVTEPYATSLNSFDLHGLIESQQQQHLPGSNRIEHKQYYFEVHIKKYRRVIIHLKFDTKVSIIKFHHIYKTNIIPKYYLGTHKHIVLL